MSSWIMVLQVILLVLTGSTLAFVLWVLHKTRQVHLATFRIVDDVSVTRRESLALFSQFQALDALKTRLGFNHLPPMRGWAGSPDFLLTVAEIVSSRKPASVVECSSGVSTLVIARCLQLNGSGHVYSLEHEQAYADKTSNLLENYAVGEWATVLHAPLINRGKDAPWYDDHVLPQEVNEISMLVVDGPPAGTALLARLPAIPRLLQRMADSVVVILDDAARDSEKEIVRQWIKLYPDFSATYLNHEKGCVLLER